MGGPFVPQFHEQNDPSKKRESAPDPAVFRTPLSIRGKSVPNRIVYQPMEGCDGTPAGEPGELTLRRYERFAQGGAGVIWLEATAVLPEARANPRQLYLNDATQDSFARMAEHIRETCMRAHGFAPLLILQLTHSGRYSKPHGVPEPLIAVNNPLFEVDAPIPESRILSDDALAAVGGTMAGVAARAKAAGFDGVDVKCCHRYLYSELLSAHTRPGRYGGSFENRTRLLRDTLDAVRGTCGNDFILATRLNVYDGFPYPYGFGVSPDGGLAFDPAEGVRLVQDCVNAGADLINVTMGNPYVNPHVNRPSAMGASRSEAELPEQGVARLLEGARRMQAAVPGTPVVCSGLSFLGARGGEQAAEDLAAGAYALAGFGRMTLAYPDLAADLCAGRGLDPAKCCVACGKCSQVMRAGGTPGCVVRDSEVYLPIYRALCR